MNDAKVRPRHPLTWIPTLYLAEGLPYVIVMTVSVIMYKGFGISNTDIALYTSWLYLPWVIKPLWSPLVDLLGTRRRWIWALQLVIGAGLGGLALTFSLPQMFQWSLAVLWLVAFSSATHDIAADGFYMLATNTEEQARYVGVRSMFYRGATIFGQGLIVIMAGYLQTHTGLPRADINVVTDASATLTQEIDSAWVRPAPARVGDLRILAEPEILSIAPQQRQKADVAAILTAARAHNEAHGFQRPPELELPQRASSKPPSAWSRFVTTPISDGWSRNVAKPLADYLRRTFGPKQPRAISFAGNVGIVRVSLSSPPGKSIVVTPAFRSGDASISMKEGSRLVFDNSNWNQSALVVLQLDPKLKGSATAVFEVRSGDIPWSWMITFLMLAVLFVMFGVWHLLSLPRSVNDASGRATNFGALLREFGATFSAFFRRPGVGTMLLFLLLYRLGEAQLVKMVAPFLLDPREVGGLGLTTGQVGWVYGTIGIAALTLGGVVGGIVAAASGLRKWLWPMLLAIHVPDAVFIYLAAAQPTNLWITQICIALEQFGYGFGFTAFLLYMLQISRGEHQTAHYAICTGFMALGMMIPGMWSGWLQELIGYKQFFVWVILATIPSFLVALRIRIDEPPAKVPAN